MTSYEADFESECCYVICVWQSGWVSIGNHEKEVESDYFNMSLFCGVVEWVRGYV